MIARLQQVITLGLFAALLSASAWLWGSGHPWAAVLVVLAGLLGHAVVLGIEFMVMRHINRRLTGHGPHPAPRELLGAWLKESWHAPSVFCWRQPFRSRSIADHLPTATSGQRRRGVLLVHGFVCNRGLWNPWLRRLRAQGTPFVALNLEPAFGDIDDYVATIDEGVRRLQATTGCAPLVVAHSMGGLAVLRWWAEPGHDERIAHLISVGTPYHGTWLARFALPRNARQMRQDSPWLNRLHASTPLTCAAHTTCFYSNADNIVFPTCSAKLPHADNRLLHGVPHVAMVDDPRVWAELQQRLQD